MIAIGPSDHLFNALQMHIITRLWGYKTDRIKVCKVNKKCEHILWLRWKLAQIKDSLERIPLIGIWWKFVELWPIICKKNGHRSVTPTIKVNCWKECVHNHCMIVLNAKSSSFQAYQTNCLEEWTENWSVVGIIILESICSSRVESD